MSPNILYCEVLSSKHTGFLFLYRCGSCFVKEPQGSVNPLTFVHITHLFSWGCSEKCLETRDHCKAPSCFEGIQEVHSAFWSPQDFYKYIPTYIIFSFPLRHRAGCFAKPWTLQIHLIIFAWIAGNVHICRKKYLPAPSLTMVVGTQFTFFARNCMSCLDIHRKRILLNPWDCISID